MLNQTRRLGILAAVLLAGAACQDLDIINPNEPGRERALTDPEAVEALLGGAYNVMHNSALHGNFSTANRGGFVHVIYTFPSVATEMTGDIVISAAITLIDEPRVNPVDNQPNPADITGQWGPRALWEGLMETASTATDGLRFINAAREQGVELFGANTARAEAFAKFMQGWAWGYAALHYDQVVVVDETQAISVDPITQAAENLIPWEDALEKAVQALGEAADIASEHSITLPDQTERLFFAGPTPVSTEQFVGAANTLAARLIVLSARRPENRETLYPERNLGWDRVLTLTENGITEDLLVTLESGFRTSPLTFFMQSHTTGNQLRMDNRLIGQADISGEYQEWISIEELGSRDRFDIVTPDRRIAGPAPAPGLNPPAGEEPGFDHGHHGAYVRYHHLTTGFRPVVPYLQSAYQWRRHSHELGSTDINSTDSDQGTARAITVDENNLLRAEALYYTGDLPGAAALVNITRTREHTLPDGNTYPGLPEVTEDGAPHSSILADDCVPRTDAGECGDLLVAIRYERMIELAGYDATRGLADSRGFGLLPDGTFIHMPVPGNELQVFRLPIYTLGGLANPESGAVYAPVGSGWAGQ